MKNLIINFTLKGAIVVFVIAILVFFDLQLKAITPTSKDSIRTCLAIEGKILNNPSKQSDVYRVELISANKIVETILVKTKEGFIFILKKNTHYAIRLSKPGHIPKLVSVHTDMPVDAKGVHLLEFSTELITTEESKEFDSEALDFPIAVISYNGKKREFDWNRNYTFEIKKQMYAVDH